MTTSNHPENLKPNEAHDLGQISIQPQAVSATAAAAAKVAKPKKVKTVSHAKQEQAALPLPVVDNSPEFGQMNPKQIVVLDQVRKAFNEAALNELAMDIAYRGILQPLTVRYRDGQYVLVAGERRLRAAILANMDSVPVLIKEIDDKQHALAQLAENIQREDLTLKEEAEAVALLYKEVGNVQAVGAKLHKSKSWVSKRLALASGLGYWASSLLNEGITEDIELLQTVHQLELHTSGSNACWALCEKIKKGEAGREDAREALRRAKEPKPTGDEPTKQQKTADPDPMNESRYFREWLKTPYPNASDYEACLFSILEDSSAAAHRERLQNAIQSLRDQINEAQQELLAHLKHHTAKAREAYGPLALHEGWIQYANTKDPHK